MTSRRRDRLGRSASLIREGLLVPGWFPVPCLVGRVIQTQQPGRVPQVGTGGSLATPLQGSVGVVRCTRVMPGANSEHESGDGRLPVSMVLRRAPRRGAPFCDKCSCGYREPALAGGFPVAAK